MNLTMISIPGGPLIIQVQRESFLNGSGNIGLYNFPLESKISPPQPVPSVDDM